MNEKGNISDQQAVISIPNSLREQLQRAQLLLNQAEHADLNGRHDVATIKAHQAVNVFTALIERSTEAGLLAVLAEIGNQGFEYQTVEHIDSFVVLERRLFGLSFGQFVAPTRTVTRRESRGRAF
ncbi:MAG: hypothetical protein HONBIEJF_02518 [Fimbriimonadaceae bacterium]|nr:hypothetical protein [Fimbriimonadaceae bacterium]